ncbi:CCR4-NOT transcription complex subunit 10, putative [Trypanosoma equiperdum]|uniref:CCR4-NOT transcription complex subunit 10 n=2 Tax=Trypanozoon TaxID=39700 RepID=Q38AA1_TRYB2|nr:hypothetical protein, conserved [Trypanosoma brucei brucei TREU927]EAN78269.1 hypothetical protein, conserved [Trypanosoma brucei brucei TREU927]SCU71321.1 CCR4-NOT transcription complex subunit 10, putative [Trypanosoma equiperdum]
MTDDVLRQQLEKVRKAFEAQDYQTCETLLQKMPKDDLQVQHNLAIVRLLLNHADVEQTIAALGDTSSDAFSSTNDKDTKPNVTLLYEGHETAHFNRALLLARSGLVHEAAVILRALLAMHTSISVAVLARVLSLLQAITRMPPGSRHRQRSDDELIQQVLSEKLNAFNEDPALSLMVKAAFSDMGNIHELPHATDGEGAAHFNNLGVLAMGDSKLNVASLCFAKAEKAAQQCNSLLVRQPIVYNAGLCALFRGEYDSAITCFLSVQELMKSSPLFWVRFAEASIGKLHAQKRVRSREEYERMQDCFSEQLHNGKLLPNYEFLTLPWAVITQSPLVDLKDNSVGTALEALASCAIQNALALLLPQNHTTISATDAFPHNAQLIHFALFYWCALEIVRKNYTVVVNVGSDLLLLHDRRPLSPNLHTALLSYMVEALVHLNEPDRALKVLRRSSLSSLVAGSPPEQLDAYQQGRVEVLFINLAITHIVNGSWSQATSVVDSLLSKLYETRAAKEKDESSSGNNQDAVLAYHLLVIFLELAQGNQEKAQEALQRLSWCA